MLRTFSFTALAGVFLVSASPYQPPMPQERAGAYPPCSRSLRDRCIQLHERGIASEENLARNDDLGASETAAPDDVYAAAPEDDEATAIMAPGDQTADYPRCSGSVADRCVQAYEGRARHGDRMAAAHHQRREMQLAMVAGERG